jgi:hypothetical protein
MINIKVEKNAAKLSISGMRGKVSNLRPVFISFQAYMQRRLTMMFSRLKRGGKYRGVTWRWFAIQYVRKDGTVVPAEGGIKKVRGGGVVQGRKRQSGKRINKNSSLMQDVVTMKNAVLSQQRIRARILVMDTPTDYAEYQHALRPFQFFEQPKDSDVLADMLNRRLGRA